MFFLTLFERWPRNVLPGEWGKKDVPFDFVWGEGVPFALFEVWNRIFFCPCSKGQCH